MNEQTPNPQTTQPTRNGKDRTMPNITAQEAAASSAAAFAQAKDLLAGVEGISDQLTAKVSLLIQLGDRWRHLAEAIAAQNDLMTAK